MQHNGSNQDEIYIISVVGMMRINPGATQVHGGSDRKKGQDPPLIKIIAISTAGITGIICLTCKWYSKKKLTAA